ncbi:hypothetical protein PSHT_00120 [Puccinia striiformis]|uniref:Uncharacterized protein n=1 Tax=Puccinia striiformis TaxID=27350 RepID=A0A2S4WNW7_9BASI|nr:hypothetical protein PSHT_00120 [Puccinia striiformis]
MTFPIQRPISEDHSRVIRVAFLTSIRSYVPSLSISFSIIASTYLVFALRCLFPLSVLLPLLHMIFLR